MEDAASVMLEDAVRFSVNNLAKQVKLRTEVDGCMRNRRCFGTNMNMTFDTHLSSIRAVRPGQKAPNKAQNMSEAWRSEQNVGRNDH